MGKPKDVRVYCPECRGGKNTIWKGSLIDWGLQLSNPDPPEWYLYALRHEEAHPSHKIMVEYPSRTVPLQLSFALLKEAEGDG